MSGSSRSAPRRFCTSPAWRRNFCRVGFPSLGPCGPARPRAERRGAEFTVGWPTWLVWLSEASPCRSCPPWVAPTVGSDCLYGLPPPECGFSMAGRRLNFATGAGAWSRLVWSAAATARAARGGSQWVAVSWNMVPWAAFSPWIKGPLRAGKNAFPYSEHIAKLSVPTQISTMTTTRMSSRTTRIPTGITTPKIYVPVLEAEAEELFVLVHRSDDGQPAGYLQPGRPGRPDVGVLQRFSGHYAALVLGLIPACSVVFFPLSSRLFLPLAGLFSLLRRGPVFAPGIKFPGASDGGYVRGPENLYLRGRFRVLLISGVFPYLCRYENG